MMRLLGILLGILLMSIVTRAEDHSPKKTESGSPVNRKPGSKNIEFDEKVVEGMNARELGSAEHIGENRSKKTDRLIREKVDFDHDVERSLKELKWLP